MARPVNITVNGNAQVDTSDSKFGGAALLLTASNQAALTINDTSLAFSGSDTFTIEMFFNADFATSFHQLYSVGWYSSNSQFVLALNNQSQIQFQSSNDGSSNSGYATTSAVSLNAWHHLALTFNAGAMQIYVDGVRQVSQTGVLIYNSPAPSDPVIGASINAANDFFDGHIDEIRVSNVVRYSGTSFSVPTVAFVNDSNTLLLLHCDGADGSTTFTDDTSTLVATPTNLSVTNITSTSARLNWSQGV